MKKIISITLAVVLVLHISVSALSDGGMSWLFGLMNSDEGTTYYVDSVGGDDSNSGTSESKAWKSIDRANQVVLSGGDKLLFKSGCTFIGQLMPQGVGSADKGAIVISSYGDGAKPIIDANGETANDGAVIRLYNQEYFEISDLQLKNNSSKRGRRNGVLVIARDFGVANHIYVKNCDIHDVVTNHRKESILQMAAVGGEADLIPNNGAFCGGIVFISLRGGDRIPTAYNDVLIDGNSISKTGENGSGIIFGSDWQGFSQDGYNDDTWSPFFGSTNVLISNNDLKNTAQAIRIQSMDGGVGNGVVVENNVSYKPDNSDSNSGMWLSSSKDVIWQYNEIYGLDNGGMNDCGAFDADGNTLRTVFQYNYTHDNRGEAVMFCNIHWNSDYEPTNAIGNIFRYNVSQNDMWGANASHGRLWVQKGARDSYFYNNVIYVGEGLTGNNIAVQESENNYFYNNIFINESEAATYNINDAASVTIENNCFYGYHPDSEPVLDSSNIVLNISDSSPVVNAGSGGIGIDTLQGYMLSDNSPCIGKGKKIANNGYKDFFGNSFTDTTAVDIGVHQTTSFVDSKKPSAFSLSVSNKSFNSIALNWNEAKDNSAINRYVIYVDNKPVGATLENSWTAENLIGNTDYSFYVRAFDSAGNYVDSNIVTATTKTPLANENKLTVLDAATYDVNGTATTSFSPEKFAAARFTVVDGNNNPVKAARVEALVEAQGQNSYRNLAAYTDENGIAQIGFDTEYYPTDTKCIIKVTDVIKEGYSYNPQQDDEISLNVSGSGQNKFSNLITNSDFDYSFVLGKLYGWTVTKSDSCNISVSDSEGMDAGKALKITSDKAFEAQISQSVTNAPDGVYSLTMWVKNTADSLVVSANSIPCIVGNEPEWKQISISNIEVVSGKISLNINVVGTDSQYVLIDKIRLSKNLIKNSMFGNVHPSVNLPSNFTYCTEDVTLSANGLISDKADIGSSFEAIEILPEYGTDYINVIRVGDTAPFNVKMEQTITNLADGVYTFYIKTVNKGRINGNITVKDYGGNTLTKKIRNSSNTAVTKIGAIEVSGGKATVEITFDGKGSAEDYIILSEINFSARDDYPELASVTPAEFNLLNAYNCSFENNTTTSPAKWKNLWSRGTPEYFVTTEDAHSGSYSAKIVLDGANDAINFKPSMDTFSGLSNGLYTFSAWIKGTYKVKVTATADGVNAYEKYSKISNEWNYVEIKNILVVDGTLSVGFWNAVSTDETVYALIDDASLIRNTASYDIATKIVALPDVEKGEKTVTLPEFEGYDIKIVSSADEDIIKTNGSVITPRYPTTVAVELCITNKAYPEDVSYVNLGVKVCGIQSDKNEAVSFVLGDANFDGYVNLLDIIRLKKFLASEVSDVNFVAVDDNNDNTLNAEDVVSLKKIILGIDSYGAYSQGEANWNSAWDALLS